GWLLTNMSRQQPLEIESRLVAPGASAALRPAAVLRLGATCLRFLAPREGMSTQTGDTGVIPTGASRMLRPGITLQFALQGRGRPGVWRALGLVGLALLLVCTAVTLTTLALLGRQAAHDGGLRQLLAAAMVPLMSVLGICVLIFLLDRYEREPWSL